MRLLINVLWLQIGLWLAGSAPALALEVGVARVDITPKLPIRLQGYGRKQESKEVEQRIWAKALAIHLPDQKPLVLVTVDTLAVPREMRDAIAKHLQDDHGIPDDHVMICASHTHTGPAVASVASLIFGQELSQAEREHIAAYTSKLGKDLQQVCADALKDRKAATWQWHEGTATFAANRRVLKEGKWVGFGVNPTGPFDHALGLLSFVDADKKLLAVVVNYACHGTTLTGAFNKVGGDWMGYAQEIIEREHPGTVAMVSIGCGADANPEPRGDLDMAVAHGNAIAREVERLLATDGRKLSESVSVGGETLGLPLATPEPDVWSERSKQSNLAGFHARVQLARIAAGKQLPTEISYRIRTWNLADNFSFVFLPGEVVVAYALRLKRELPDKTLWISAYTNDVPCYIPSRRILSEGGYEAEQAMYYYDQPGPLKTDVEALIIDTTKKLVSQQPNQ